MNRAGRYLRRGIVISCLVLASLLISLSFQETRFHPWTSA